MIGFGLDLAGYTTNKTSLAAIVSDGSTAEAVLLRRSAFSIARRSEAQAQEVIEAEAKDLEACLRIGPVAVDIPIDLQNLLTSDRATAIWELTRRPIDKKLGAMAPLADRIGAPVARFSAIMRKGDFYENLGNDLFETYPAEIMRRLQFQAKYKLRDSGKEQERRVACEELCRFLAIDQNCYDDDDLDALVCALAAVASQDALVAQNEFDLDGYGLPRGFRILKRKLFGRITLRECNFDAWIANVPGRASAV